MVSHFSKGLRSFHAGDMGFVGQRAANLLAFKVGGLKKVYGSALALVKPVGPIFEFAQG